MLCVHEDADRTLQVSWSGASDAKNPLNWPFQRKWAVTFIVSCFTFITPISSSIVAPGLGTIGEVFDTKDSFQIQMVLSIFILSFCVGPLFLTPLSEIYGRTSVLQITNLLFLVLNTACSGAKTMKILLGFRFLSGLGASVSSSVSATALAIIF
jgi:MFS family permease